MRPRKNGHDPSNMTGGCETVGDFIIETKRTISFGYERLNMKQDGHRSACVEFAIHGPADDECPCESWWQMKYIRTKGNEAPDHWTVDTMLDHLLEYLPPPILDTRLAVRRLLQAMLPNAQLQVAKLSSAQYIEYIRDHPVLWCKLTTPIPDDWYKRKGMKVPTKTAVLTKSVKGTAQ